jgi:hypothetical protein
MKPAPLNYVVIREARKWSNSIMEKHGLAIKFYAVLIPRKADKSYGSSFAESLLYKNTMITGINENYVEELFPFHTGGWSRLRLMKKIKKKKWVNADELVWLVTYTMMHELGHCMKGTVEHVYNREYAFFDTKIEKNVQYLLKRIYDEYGWGGEEEWASNFAEYMLDTGLATNTVLIKELITVFRNT